MILPLLIVIAATAAAVIARGLIFHFLHKWGRRIESKIADITTDSVRLPSIFWCIAIGLYSGIASSEVPERYAFYILIALHVGVIFSATIATANFAGKIFKSYVQRSDLPVPTTGLAYGILKGTIYIVGILIILAILGISIAPLLTALGVGGLAVALALQDTLANLFAGIHILVEKSIRVGDFIRLESGQKGRVEDITWRTTRIKTMPNTMVVIPNNKLSQSVVTNYSLPDKMMILMLPVNVSYDSDPERVEAILIDEIERAKDEITGLVVDGKTAVRLMNFSDSSLDFTLMCPIREYSDRQVVQHEIRKRIIKRFKNEGIEIPFPQRVVYLKGEKAS